MRRFATTDLDQASMRITDLRLLGDRLCLDFANTIEMPIANQPLDLLRGYADLVAWGAMAGLLDPSEADRLRNAGERRARDAEEVLARAIELRAAISGVFTAIAEGSSPADDDLAKLDREYRAAMARTRLTATPGGYELTWSDENTALDRVLWPVARSAVDLLIEGDPDRVKQCPGPDGGCGWLFYDVSKNRSRHWCSMEGCGSQAKMQRYRKRLRSKSEEIP